jgi:hypothetical protein
LEKQFDSHQGEVFLSAVEAGHPRIVHVLERRIEELRRFCRAWDAGDNHAMLDVLEASQDDVLLYGALQRLESHYPKALPPRMLARLLRLAQRLSESNCETHAVAAMRFAKKAIELSWPHVARSLKNVATPKSTFDDCQAAVQSVSLFFKLIKTLSRSVRITRTNGPLVPVCRDLKMCLEKALSTVGRVRGSC